MLLWSPAGRQPLQPVTFWFPGSPLFWPVLHPLESLSALLLRVSARTLPLLHGIFFLIIFLLSSVTIMPMSWHPSLSQLGHIFLTYATLAYAMYL